MPILGKNGLLKGKGKVPSNLEILKDKIGQVATESLDCAKPKTINPKPKVRKYIKF